MKNRKFGIGGQEQAVAPCADPYILEGGPPLKVVQRHCKEKDDTMSLRFPDPSWVYDNLQETDPQAFDLETERALASLKRELEALRPVARDSDTNIFNEILNALRQDVGAPVPSDPETMSGIAAKPRKEETSPFFDASLQATLEGFRALRSQRGFSIQASRLLLGHREPKMVLDWFLGYLTPPRDLNMKTTVEKALLKTYLLCPEEYEASAKAVQSESFVWSDAAFGGVECLRLHNLIRGSFPEEIWRNTNLARFGMTSVIYKFSGDLERARKYNLVGRFWNFSNQQELMQTYSASDTILDKQKLEH
jgi:hypothetical protein